MRRNYKHRAAPKLVAPVNPWEGYGMMDMRIIHDDEIRTVPLEMFNHHGRQIALNHRGATVHGLNQGGGLQVREAIAILEDRAPSGLHILSDKHARERLYELVELYVQAKLICAAMGQPESMAAMIAKGMDVERRRALCA